MRRNIFLSPVIGEKNSCHWRKCSAPLIIRRSCGTNARARNHAHLRRVRNRLSNSAPLRVYVDSGRQLKFTSTAARRLSFAGLGPNPYASAKHQCSRSNSESRTSIICESRTRSNISRRRFHDGSANRLARAILGRRRESRVRGREPCRQTHDRTTRNYDTASYS